VGINGIDVKNFDELLSYLLANVYPGESVTLTYIRDGQTMTTDLVVGARPRSN
jgi:S1-C subfamily serine protease